MEKTLKVARMRRLLMAAFLTTWVVTFLTQNAGAEKQYVTDVLWLTLRTEPKIGSESLKAIQSGQEVERIATAENWAQVRLPDGTSGWVLQKYLTPQITAGRQLKILQNKYAALEEQTRLLRQENERLKQDHQKLRDELAQKMRQSADMASAYETLKTEAAGFIELKEKFEKTNIALKEQSAKAEQLDDELSKIASQKILRWFLAGAGVLLLGFIIGFSAKRQRRRTFLA
jgi:SH3 domain protein